MAQATAHPDRRLISSEDVQGTNVYGIGDEAIGEIDHLLIEKISGRVAYAVMSFGGFLGLAHSHYPIPWSALKYDTALRGYRTRDHRSATERHAPLSATISGPIETGRPELISTTAHPRTGVHHSNSDERELTSIQKQEGPSERHFSLRRRSRTPRKADNERSGQPCDNDQE